MFARLASRVKEEKNGIRTISTMVQPTKDPLATAIVKSVPWGPWTKRKGRKREESAPYTFYLARVSTLSADDDTTLECRGTSRIAHRYLSRSREVHLPFQ